MNTTPASRRVSFRAFSLLVAALGCVSMLAVVAGASEYTLVTTATAYNCVPEQTDSTPNIAAWGDILAPGMRVIAVSHDLLTDGLAYGVSVTIDGLPGEYIVLDKMSPRWSNKIDIFMGYDVVAAREWGRRQVTIHYWKTDHYADDALTGDMANPAEADDAVDPDQVIPDWAENPFEGDMALPPVPGENLALR